MSDLKATLGYKDVPAGPTSPPPPAPVTVVLTRSILTPVEVWSKFAEIGAGKTQFSLPKKLLLSFLAGCYLSFGVILAYSVGGQLTTGTAGNAARAANPGLFNIIFGFFGLPFGLTMIILMGAELFTSDVAIMLIAWLEGRATVPSIAWNWIYCWFGNLCGSLWMVQMVIWAQTYTSPATIAFAASVALRKTTLGWGIMFVRGMLCNWLVNIAVWQAMSAMDVTGKFISVFIPITIFVAAGFEHCIADMFILALGIRTGDVSSARDAVVHNLIPVTLGNIASAAIFIVLFYAFSYGSAHDQFVSSWNAGVARVLGCSPKVARLFMTGSDAAADRALVEAAARCNAFEDSARKASGSASGSGSA